MPLRQPERSVLIEDEVEWVLPVTVRRISHVDPFPNGALVRYRYVNGILYDELDPDLDREGGRMRNKPPGFSGIVMERIWHVDKFDLFRAEIDPVITTRRTRPHLRNVAMQLYYRVMFPAGMFWARYDWLEEIVPTGT